MKINIIGDIAGRFNELQELLAIMPKADLILSVGDIIDRGPDSKKVIEWFMSTPNTEVIYGNHEDMMYEVATKNDYTYRHLWLRNGGLSTVVNYLPPGTEDLSQVDFDVDHIDWLSKRPMYFETNDLFVSHAPITSLNCIPKDPYGRDHYFIWNRFEPSKPQSKFIVNGHNGKFRWYKWGDGNVFGACIDDSHNLKLTGMHWPSKEIFQVDIK